MLKSNVLANKVEYPALFTHTSGLVVLMVEPGVGTIVATSTRFQLGYTSREWKMNEFTQFVGTLTLTQGD